MATKYKQEAWSLDVLFPSLDSPKIDRALEDFEKQIQAFEAYRSELKEDRLILDHL